MSVSGTTTDYTGRALDILIFKGVNPYGEATVTPSFGKVSQYCAGVQKLIQRYAIKLLNVAGSQPNFPDFGTDLMSTLNSSNMSIGRADLMGIFNYANAQVVMDFQNYQRTSNGLPDEQLNTALLNDIELINGGVYITVTIYPVSGAPVTFVLPLPLQ